MPFALIIIGLVLVVSAVKNSVTDNSSTGQKGLVTLVKGDFTGQNNYIYWMVSILVIGALGYFDSFKTFSRITMGLIVVVLFVSGKQGTNFFSNFQSALSNLGTGNFSSILPSLVNPSSVVSAVSPTATTGSAEDSLMQQEQSALQDALGQYSAAAANGIPGTAAKAQQAQQVLNTQF